MVKWGQRVIVDRRGIRTDILNTVTNAASRDITGKVINVVPEQSSLQGSVLIAFDGHDLVQWVHEIYLRPTE
jgi:hypothetical protein